ncbi:3'-5' exonuclease [uncultured Sphaerotilus sp.]|uniref:3'-5' exonuclease n=1 Tax=uncultured Sphaerotilus sp. TaxID=474984 RepID=UPI0030CA4C25
MSGGTGGLFGQWAALKRAWMLWHLADQRLRFLYDEPPPNEWVSLDCETTGLDTRRDDIISIGAVRIVGDRVMTSEALSLLVRPSKALTADSVRVHRLRDQDVADGLEPEEAMRQLLAFIGGRPLVGYFLEFDVAMVNRVIWPMLGVALPQQKIEISTLFYEYKSRQFRGHEQDRHIDLRFDTVMTELDLPQRDAHDALNDAVMAALAFIKLRHLA